VPAAAVALLAIAFGALGPRLASLHAWLGVASVALVLVRGFRNRLVPAALALGLAECLLRGEIVHACLAPMFFAGCVAAAQSEPIPRGVSMFAKAVRFAPLLVLCQIVLGAAYRHKAIGVMPHLAGAMIAAGFLLVVATLILQRPGQGASAEKAAGALVAIALLQVSLGIVVFVMRMLDADTSAAFTPLAAAHVAVGALTLAASTVLAMRVE